jgi:hypothetical protein
VPELKVFLSSNLTGVTDSYGKRKIDPQAMAAARKVCRELDLPNSKFSFSSVINHTAKVDPLLSTLAQPVLKRLALMEGMANNGGTEQVEVLMPIQARYYLEQMAGANIRAWKILARDPVRYFSAALIEIYG